MRSMAVNGYTEEQVKAQLHGATGTRLVKYRYDLINRYDIKQGELTVQDGSSITFDSEAIVKRTARFRIKENELQDVDWLNDRIQPVFCLKMPDGKYAEFPLGIFLLPSSSRENVGSAIIRPIDAYDPMQILVEDKFMSRYRISAGTNYIAAVTSIISGAGITKINITANDATLGTDREFAIGDLKIDSINSLLDEINYYSLWVDNDGYFVSSPYVLPSTREVEYEYRDDSLSIICPDAIDSIDLFDAPNSWIAIVGNPEREPLVSTYQNTLPTSPTSTVRRGRNIVKPPYRVNDIADQATLDEWLHRQAYNDSQIYDNFIFNTAAMPHHDYLNCLYINYSNLGIAAKFIETYWKMSLDVGEKMEHICRRVIYI